MSNREKVMNGSEIASHRIADYVNNNLVIGNTLLGDSGKNEIKCIIFESMVEAEVDTSGKKLEVPNV